MACPKNLRTEFLDDADPGGEWAYDGYHASNPAGTPGAGGTNPGALTGDDPELDFSSWIPGFYFFTYGGGEGACADDVQFPIPVAPAPCVTHPENIEVCEGGYGGQQTGNSLFARFIEESECYNSTWHEYDYVIPEDSDAFPEGWLDDFEDENIGGDINELAPGVYKITGRMTMKAIAGFAFDCEDCEGAEYTWTITVNAAFAAGTPTNIAVCN